MERMTLVLKKAGQEGHFPHPVETLWTYSKPDDEWVFNHFIGHTEAIAIVNSLIPNLVRVAQLHGWKVIKE